MKKLIKINVIDLFWIHFRYEAKQGVFFMIHLLGINYKALFEISFTGSSLKKFYIEFHIFYKVFTFNRYKL